MSNVGTGKPGMSVEPDALTMSQYNDTSVIMKIVPHWAQGPVGRHR